MKIILLTSLLCLTILASFGQKRYASISITNNVPAMPFAKFGGLFKSPLHPGVEFGYGFNWKTKQHHDIYQTLNAGYFFHRFVQHAITFYTNLGYRYKFSRFSAEASLGVGYLHSIPAVAKLKLNNNGEYENNKGVGRMQAMANLNLGIAYTVNPNAKRSAALFTGYRQLLQMPFIKSYVPLLPYNSFAVGVRFPLSR